MKKVVCVISLAFLLSGCACWNWLITDNPSAPSVVSPNDGVHDWPVFKETNTVNLATNVPAVKDAKMQDR